MNFTVMLKSIGLLKFLSLPQHNFVTSYPGYCRLENISLLNYADLQDVDTLYNKMPRCHRCHITNLIRKLLSIEKLSQAQEDGYKLSKVLISA